MNVRDEAFYAEFNHMSTRKNGDYPAVEVDFLTRNFNTQFLAPFHKLLKDGIW